MHPIAIAALALALMSHPAIAQTPSMPAIVQTDAQGTHTLLQCGADEMPVYTEGATTEIIDGKRVASATGVSKCVAITEAVRNTEAGGSANLSWENGRQVGVVNCPAGTVPFAMSMQHYTVTIDPAKPLPHYVVAAPVLVRCMETADFAKQDH